MARHLRIENDLDSLRPMSAWVAESCKALGLPAELSYRFDLVANEAVANTISYGYAPGARGAIDLHLDTAHGHAILIIEDDGAAFNPLELAEPQPALSIEDSRVGGLGVALIRRSMALCDYQRRGGHNVLTLKSPLLDG